MSEAWWSVRLLGTRGRTQVPGVSYFCSSTLSEAGRREEERMTVHFLLLVVHNHRLNKL
jgi:hypothetical protein